MGADDVDDMVIEVRSGNRVGWVGLGWVVGRRQECANGHFVCVLAR